MTVPCDLFLLDLGNVLVKFDHALIARKLAKLSRQPVFAIIAKFIRSGIGVAFDEGRISSEEFVTCMQRDLGIKLSYEEFCAIWNEIFFENPGMDGLVRRLKERYKVFVISDTNRLHFEYIRKRFPILSHVDRFILSYEVGVCKPHPKIFEEALRQGGTRAERTFFTDDREEIVRAAEKLGFRVHHFRDAAALEKTLVENKLLQGG